MLKKQRTYRRTLLFGVLTVLFATLLFGVLLIFSSAYLREKENKEISNAILNKCIQETDSTLSSLDQMITEFLLDNSHINEYMVMKDIERIEEYKMKQSLNRFNQNLNYYYGDEVSLYLFAPRSDRIYLNGALYKYSRFGHEAWVEQISALNVTDAWVRKNDISAYSGYESFSEFDGFIRSYKYPLGTYNSYGSASVLMPKHLLVRFIESSLPTDESQIYVLDDQDRLLYAAGKEYQKYTDEMLKRKDGSKLFHWPSAPSYYRYTSQNTGWQFILRIPKRGIISLWSPIGTLYALIVLLYCAGISLYLAFLFGKPYRFIRQMIQLMRGTITESQNIQAEEFLELRTGFLDLNNSIDELRNQLDVYRFEVCDELILDLITSNRIVSYEEHEQKMREAGLKFYTHSFQAILVSHAEGEPVSSDQVLERITPLRDETTCFLCTQASADSVLLLLTSAVPLDPGLLSKTLEGLQKQFEDQKLILGLGSVCIHPEDLVSSYEHAKLSTQSGIRYKQQGLVDYRTVTEDTRKNELGEQIVRFIHENYSNPEFSLKMIESTFSMTASHLARVYKDYTGETIQHDLTRIRVEKAEQLMKEHPREPLERIAEQVGYVNVQALNRAFKKERGMPPRTSSKTQNTMGGSL